jgi:hypothetical protein
LVSYQNRNQMRAFNNDELRRRIDEVLFYVWDPIGVADEPYARAEYEGYVSDVLELVEKSEQSQPIADYLDHVVKSRMALSPNSEHSKLTAELLLRHKLAIKDGCA